MIYHRDMEILLTNDDGYDSEGLASLERAFIAAGHGVTVVAPDQERSACSHSITLFTPLFVQERRTGGRERPVYAVNGTPTDCCKLALNEIVADRKPDLVVSGINLGANLGANIFYSGTIGGAFEGVLAGIPAIAISVEGQSSEHVDEIARLAVNLVEKLVVGVTGDLCRERLLMYNINFPDCHPTLIKGVRVAPHGRSAFADDYEMRIDPRQRAYYWLSGVQGYVYPPGRSSTPDDDLGVVSSGHVAITPLKFDLNCPEELDRLAGLDFELAEGPRDPG